LVALDLAVYPDWSALLAIRLGRVAVGVLLAIPIVDGLWV